MQISCRRSCWRPRQPTIRWSPLAISAPSEAREGPACRLHARV